MTSKLEIIVPKRDSARVMKAMVDKLTAMGIELIPFHRGTIDDRDTQNSTLWIEVPQSFKRLDLQELAEAVNLNISKKATP